MAMSIEDIRKAMASALPNDGYEYFKKEEEGGYLLELVKLHYKQEGHKKKAGYIADLKVIEAESGKAPVGSIRSATFWTSNEGWNGRFAKFLTVFFPEPELSGREDTRAEFSVEIMKAGGAGLPADILAGRRAYAFTYPMKSRAGVEIMAMKWLQAASGT